MKTLLFLASGFIGCTLLLAALEKIEVCDRPDQKQSHSLINFDKKKPIRVPPVGIPPRRDKGIILPFEQLISQDCKPTPCPKDEYCPPNCGHPEGEPIGSGRRV